MNEPSRLKKLLPFILSFAIVAAIFMIGNILSQRGKTGFTLFYSPTDAKIYVNNKEINAKNKSFIRTGSGTYTIKASREHFKDTSIKVVVSRGKNADAAILMEPSDDQGREILLKGAEQQPREEAGYRQSVDVGNKATEKAPLIKYLPAVTVNFRIDYGVSKKYPDDPTKVAIYITTDVESQRKLALDWIKNKGFSPDDFEIYYKSFEN